jgi:hypothetical protein
MVLYYTTNIVIPQLSFFFSKSPKTDEILILMDLEGESELLSCEECVEICEINATY